LPVSTFVAVFGGDAAMTPSDSYAIWWTVEYHADKAHDARVHEEICKRSEHARKRRQRKHWTRERAFHEMAVEVIAKLVIDALSAIR
jgi:hypothetical protein